MGGTFSSNLEFRPTDVKYKSTSCSAVLTFPCSAGCENQPGRIDTSVSPGRHAAPLGSPSLSIRVTASPSAPGYGTTPGSTVDQLVSPATPRSLPIQRTSGPASENITAFGCKRRTSAHTRGQSYTCRLPFGPSPLAPSNQTSWMLPYRVSSSVSCAAYRSL